MICHRLAESEFQPGVFRAASGLCSNFKITAVPRPVSGSAVCVLFFFLPQIHCRLRWPCQLAFLSFSVITTSSLHIDSALRQLCRRFETTCKPPQRGTAHTCWVAHERLKQPETLSSSSQLTFFLTRIIHGYLVHPQSSLPYYRRAYPYFANHNGHF